MQLAIHVGKLIHVLQSVVKARQNVRSLTVVGLVFPTSYEMLQVPQTTLQIIQFYCQCRSHF